MRQHIAILSLFMSLIGASATSFADVSGVDPVRLAGNVLDEVQANADIRQAIADLTSQHPSRCGLNTADTSANTITVDADRGIFVARYRCEGQLRSVDISGRAEFDGSIVKHLEFVSATPL